MVLVSGLGGDDEFWFDPAISTPISIDGGPGNNTLHGPEQSLTWAFSGTNAGQVGNVAFQSIANFVGGGQADTFQFADGAQITGTIDGGGGTDTLDFSGYSTGVTVNLLAGTATGVGGTVRNINNVVGGQGDNFLEGDHNANRLVSGPGNDTLFGADGGDTLIGGTGNDTFVFDQAPTPGEVDYISPQAGGTNTVDFSRVTTAPVYIDLTSDTYLARQWTPGAATGGGATYRTVKTLAAGQCNNVQDALGGGGNDSLNGNAANDDLDGGPGNDRIVAGRGNDTLIGGLGNDLIYAGSGNDVIDAGPGTNMIIGATANDTIITSSTAHTTAVHASTSQASSTSTPAGHPTTQSTSTGQASSSQASGSQAATQPAASQPTVAATTPVAVVVTPPAQVKTIPTI
jgi:Ca2+-binding RTX toxin-like protein